MKHATRAGILVILLVTLASCASKTSPSAAVAPAASAVAGTWKGAMRQATASPTAGQANITLIVTPDGSWSASTGDTGTVAVNGDTVVLQGRALDGEAVRYTLQMSQGKGAAELQGVVESKIGPANVSLKRVK